MGKTLMIMNLPKMLLLGAAMAAMAGCAEPDTAEPEPDAPRPSSVTEADLEASPVARLAKAIEDGDAAMVARHVAYPLERQEPLPSKKTELLDEKGPLALFAGETEADAAFNEAERRADPETPLFRNSLFLRRRGKDGTDEWRLLLTTGSDWREADGMNEWCVSRARELKKCFFVRNARFSSNGRHLWLVCDTQSYTYLTVCSYDVQGHVFRVLTDGDTADEESDGTIRVRNKKIYLYDDNGDSLGAAWYDEWILPDGTVVRKTEPTQRPDMP